MNNNDAQQWLNDLEQVIIKNIEISNFKVSDVAAQMFVSKRQLYRKSKKYIGLTPLNYIKTFKLNYVHNLLIHKKVSSVKYASYSIGYSNKEYFIREFKKAFNKLPSDFLDQTTLTYFKIKAQFIIGKISIILIFIFV